MPKMYNGPKPNQLETLAPHSQSKTYTHTLVLTWRTPHELAESSFLEAVGLVKRCHKSGDGNSLPMAVTIEDSYIDRCITDMKATTLVFKHQQTLP